MGGQVNALAAAQGRVAIATAGGGYKGLKVSERMMRVSVT